MYEGDPPNMDPRLLHEKDEPPKAKLTSPRVPFWFAWLLWLVGLSLAVAVAGIDSLYYANALVVIGGILIGSFFLALATVKLQGQRKE